MVILRWCYCTAYMVHIKGGLCGIPKDIVSKRK